MLKLKTLVNPEVVLDSISFNEPLLTNDTMLREKYSRTDPLNRLIYRIYQMEICLTIAELVLSPDDQFISVKGIGKQNTKQLSNAQLSVIFND